MDNNNIVHLSWCTTQFKVRLYVCYLKLFFPSNPEISMGILFLNNPWQWVSKQNIWIQTLGTATSLILVTNWYEGEHYLKIHWHIVPTHLSHSTWISYKYMHTIVWIEWLNRVTMYLRMDTSKNQMLRRKRCMVQYQYQWNGTVFKQYC